jgi:hypothetical protein
VGRSQAKPKDKKEQRAEKSRRVHDHRRSFCLLGGARVDMFLSREV